MKADLAAGRSRRAGCSGGRVLHAFRKEHGRAERDHESCGMARDLLQRYAASGGDTDGLQ